MKITILDNEDLTKSFASINNFADGIQLFVSYKGHNVFDFHNHIISIKINRDNNSIIGININKPINLYHNSLKSLRHSIMGFFASRTFRISDWNQIGKRRYEIKQLRNKKQSLRQRESAVQSKLTSLLH